MIESNISRWCGVMIAMGLAVGSPPPAGAEPGARRPNVLVIVADDLGYSDLGAFGGEIATPNLDALAKSGVAFTSFYTAPTCSPTRAMLLTGRDNHAVGLGTMAEVMMPEQRGKPGYEGHLSDRATTLAERMARAGYATFMSGKWHLGMTDDQSPAARGFQRSFALLQGAHNHFGGDQNGVYKASKGGALYRENGVPVRYPVGRYSSDYFTDRMLDYIESADPDTPFFAYMAYTAPHWPLQAPDEDIAKYRGRYDAGPAALRASRIKRMKELGLLPANIIPADEEIDDWATLTPEQRAIESRKMEVYAAMVDRMDQNIGRLIETLKATGRFDDTVIFFLSDNGAEGAVHKAPINLAAPPEVVAAKIDNGVGNIGRADSYVGYGSDWARAGTAVLRGVKGSTTEGGIRAPAFVTGAGVSGGRKTGATLHVMDVAPTVLAMAGVSQREDAAAMEGRSWLRLLEGAEQRVHADSDPLNWELFFRRAARMGRYKAVYLPNVLPRLGGSPERSAADWELYDVVADPGETRNLARSHPVVLKRLIAQWDAYAARLGVVKMPDHEVGDRAAGTERR